MTPYPKESVLAAIYVLFAWNGVVPSFPGKGLEKRPINNAQKRGLDAIEQPPFSDSTPK